MSACACMGPQNVEPLCPCRMISAGLKEPTSYLLSAEDRKNLEQVLKEIFNE